MASRSRYDSKLVTSDCYRKQHVHTLRQYVCLHQVLVLDAHIYNIYNYIYR